jgi:hypothetical protein
MDATQLYSSTLEQLNQIVIKMTSSEWNAKVQAAPSDQRQQALGELLRVQHARLVLGNAVLQEISEDLKANEQALLDGQAAVRAALDAMVAVQNVLTAVSSLINVVARIVPIL